LIKKIAIEELRRLKNNMKFLKNIPKYIYDLGLLALSCISAVTLILIWYLLNKSGFKFGIGING